MIKPKMLPKMELKDHPDQRIKRAIRWPLPRLDRSFMSPINGATKYNAIVAPINTVPIGSNKADDRRVFPFFFIFLRSQ